jgi:hypothetical protein
MWPNSCHDAYGCHRPIGQIRLLNWKVESMRTCLRLFPATLVAFAMSYAQSPAPELPGSGCPMAHCTPHLNDAVRAIAPETATLVNLDPTTAGAGKGLGCSSNGTVVACSFMSTAGPNLVVYDGSGQRVFADSTGLNENTGASAPIVFADGRVLAADNKRAVLFAPDGSIIWNTDKPDSGIPISPVLVRSTVVMLATAGGGVISTYDLSSGNLLATYRIDHPSGCGVYDTLNTPAVNGSRAYIVSACDADPSQGAISAIDVAPDGSMTEAWFYPFTGPSGSSPLFIRGVIYFDGRDPNNSSNGVFLALKDNGASATQVWRRGFPSFFAANAARDPRGGIWIFPVSSSRLYRLSEADGSIKELIDIPAPAGATGPYQASSAISVSRSIGGDVILTFGATSQLSNEPPTVMAMDVNTHVAIWDFAIGGTPGNSTAAQFPIVHNGQGLPRVVFPGSMRSTFFLGRP